jgi:cytochrome c oxidase subunit 3
LPAIPIRAYYTGMQMALAGIVMFFMALTSSFLVRKALGADWVAIALPPVVWFNSIVLLASSGTIQWANSRMEKGDRKAFRYWWGLTIGLGLLFLAGQLIAWRQLAAEGMYVSSNPDSSFFYLLTAAHGLHLAGGVLALLYVTFRNWRKSRITQATAASLTGIYWHFMDGLWLFLLALLYLGR